MILLKEYNVLFRLGRLIIYLFSRLGFRVESFYLKFSPYFYVLIGGELQAKFSAFFNVVITSIGINL